jgi:DNA-binding NarL/FixJ family response regulator
MRQAKQIRVLLADDHPAIRTGIKLKLEQSEDIVVIGEAGSGAEALRMSGELSPDLLLLDMALPDQDGVEVARLMRQFHPRVKVLVFSGYADDAFVFGVLKAGAVGYLLKDEALDKLVDAVRGAVRGEEVILSDKVVQKVVKRTRGDMPPLTEREMDVLARLVTGKTTLQIAQELHVTAKTVGNHVSNMLVKLHLTSRSELVAFALRERLVHPSKR